MPDDDDNDDYDDDDDEEEEVEVEEEEEEENGAEEGHSLQGAILGFTIYSVLIMPQTMTCMLMRKQSKVRIVWNIYQPLEMKGSSAITLTHLNLTYWLKPVERERQNGETREPPRNIHQKKKKLINK